MRIRLLAIDLDGTLLNSAKQVTKTTAEILRTAREQTGVRIVLASARPPRSVMPFYELLDLDTPMINYNGALVYEPPSGHVIWHRPVAKKTAWRIVRIAREIHPDVLVSAEILDKWYTDKFDPKFLTETAKHFKPDIVAPIDSWLTRSVTKLLLLACGPPLVRIASGILGQLPHQVTILKTEDYLLQIMHSTVSKLQALRIVAGELGTSREQIMAIGDNVNDIEMLRWASVGVAMDNAPEKVKAAAKIIADHHDNDGAAKAIRDVILRGASGNPATRVMW